MSEKVTLTSVATKLLKNIDEATTSNDISVAVQSYNTFIRSCGDILHKDSGFTLTGQLEVSTK